MAPLLPRAEECRARLTGARLAKKVARGRQPPRSNSQQQGQEESGTTPQARTTGRGEGRKERQQQQQQTNRARPGTTTTGSRRQRRGRCQRTHPAPCEVWQSDGQTCTGDGRTSARVEREIRKEASVRARNAARTCAARRSARVPHARGGRYLLRGAYAHALVAPAWRVERKHAEQRPRHRKGGVRARGAARKKCSMTNHAGPARERCEAPALTGAKRAGERASTRSTRAHRVQARGAARKLAQPDYPRDLAPMSRVPLNLAQTVRRAGHHRVARRSTRHPCAD